MYTDRPVIVFAGQCQPDQKREVARLPRKTGSDDVDGKHDGLIMSFSGASPPLMSRAKDTRPRSLGRFLCPAVSGA